MGNYNFKRDLAVAKKTEQKIAELLTEKYGATLVAFDNTNKYDLLMDIEGILTSFEIKQDFMCRFTGNVSLEFSCRGKDSGIAVSKADYYIYKIHTKNDGIIIAMCKTELLRSKVEDKKYFRIINGGDKGSNTMNYLFKLDTFLEGCTIL